MVPKGTNVSGYGASPLSAKPSETDLLMAAADMHGAGRLAVPQDEQRSMPTGPERPRLNFKGKKTNRPLKVVK
jgi:hypothetical protein